MAYFAASLGVIILWGLVILSAANKDTCEIYAAVGQSVTLPFVTERPANLHVLRWTHNNTIIFYRQQGKVSFGKAEDVSATGSLLLRKPQFSSAGIYVANMLHPNGTLAKEWIGHLCMMDKVSKPQLNYRCNFNSGAVNLNCYVAKPHGLKFSWTLDEKNLTSETRETLSISLAQLEGERSFTCSVANKVSKEKSDAVRPVCKSPSPTPPTLLCFKSKTVVAVLAGGVSLILILLVTIIILCCCHRRSKEQMKVGDKRGVRMLSLHKRETDSIFPEYETMHPTDDSPPLSPEPSPRACYETVSQPESQTENRPLQLSAGAEGQQPSPVPKPRTKSPQTANI